MIELWLTNSPSLAGPGQATRGHLHVSTTWRKLGTDIQLLLDLRLNNIPDFDVRDAQLLGLLPDLILVPYSLATWEEEASCACLSSSITT